MRQEHEATISGNIHLSRQLDIAKKALQFYSQQKHFDTVHIDGDPDDVNRTRILDNGGVAEDALKAIADL